MTENDCTVAPTYAARLTLPFVRLLQRDPRIPQDSLKSLAAIDPDERLPIGAVHELLEGCVALTGDVDIGLKAAREIAPGDWGAVEYVARFAASWGEACSAVGRYMHLVNDALRFSIHAEGEQAKIQLDTTLVLPRSVADFQSAAFHVSGVYLRPQGFEPRFEVWFSHPAPADTREYERTFAGGTLRFDAPWTGFVFPREYLQMSMPNAEPQLHTLLRKHAEAMLASLPKAQSLTQRVRDLMTQQLASGTPTLREIARQVCMSERTLARHLDDEGTSFKALLEDLRRRMALRYVRSSNLTLSEIAFLLGFSQAAAFHRAFRRWTGQTPLEYRQGSASHRG